MRNLFTLILLIFPMLSSANTQAVKDALAEYAWEKRQLVVFTPNLEDERYKQYEVVREAFSDDFSERFLQVWLIQADTQVSLDEVPNETLKPDSFYDLFSADPEAFTVILIGYDQGEKLRLPIFNINQIMGEIDQMPMRQQEMEVQSQD